MDGSWNLEKLAIRWYCHAPNPDYLTPTIVSMFDPPVDVPYVFCTRIAGHEGDHAAFTFLISTPTYWPATQIGQDTPQ